MSKHYPVTLSQRPPVHGCQFFTVLPNPFHHVHVHVHMHMYWYMYVVPCIIYMYMYMYCVSVYSTLYVHCTCTCVTMFLYMYMYLTISHSHLQTFSPSLPPSLPYLSHKVETIPGVIIYRFMAPICFVNAAVFRKRLEMVSDLHKRPKPGGEEKGCLQKLLPPVRKLSVCLSVCLTKHLKNAL